jgi:predicted Fe-Mo cluster-binding NifX family protein
MAFSTESYSEEAIMKIAISSKGTDLEAQVDPQFGRCQYFIIVDSATEGFEVVDNKAAVLSGGAGIQTAQTVVNSGSAAVVTGSLGPNSTNALMVAGLKVYLGASGTVREALQQLKEGKLHETSKAATNMQASGVGGGNAPADSRGMGRGMGLGRRWGSGGPRGLGQIGECVCPGCGARVPHQTGIPCFEQQCPRCGAGMRRF